MISVQFQVFFFDADGSLGAVQPAFSSPSTAAAVLRAQRFESKVPLVVSGPYKVIEQLLHDAQQADAQPWAGKPVKDKIELLKAMCRKLDLYCYDQPDADQQVLGDPPDRVAVEAAKAAKSKAAKKLFPPSLPSDRKVMWTKIGKENAKLIKRYGLGDPELTCRVHRILYETQCREHGLVPWAAATFQDTADERGNLRGTIERSERHGSQLLERWAKQLVDQGLVHKALVIKKHATGHDPIKSRYHLTHRIPWVLKEAKGQDWGQVRDWLLKHTNLRPNQTQQRLTATIDMACDLDIVREGDGVSAYIVHYMTPNQAALLTHKSDHDAIVATLARMMNQWYRDGVFPSVEDW